MLGMKRVEAAKTAIVNAAGDTRQAVLTVGAVAVAAVVLGVLALLVALRGRRLAGA